MPQHPPSDDALGTRLAREFLGGTDPAHLRPDTPHLAGLANLIRAAADDLDGTQHELLRLAEALRDELGRLTSGQNAGILPSGDGILQTRAGRLDGLAIRRVEQMRHLDRLTRLYTRSLPDTERSRAVPTSGPAASPPAHGARPTR
ncbi:hypothetical protein [Streptomyces sp. YIM 98790]|uniref:hypothetical protein n=1 Tax=Streptomyces sp. YIM 98790 TaxID=2689077 RepID=UPI00140AE427|nr:hypothetical protein [Streptomyces sp. YIM 98790]